ncbi:hypothetical protein D3C71_1461080 [compost metagenome]
MELQPYLGVVRAIRRAVHLDLEVSFRRGSVDNVFRLDRAERGHVGHAVGAARAAFNVARYVVDRAEEIDGTTRGETRPRGQHCH